ncbi:MAG TPA: DUF2520 domain-containing protein [Gammaproteobacteria bacterium]|jgi:predicted short-subunit dehydrogenase-like oxidoreductase (DUF2520 family)|nr:DUF2520 domain-containing protein [Gammaproteobacteria bacterium]
MRRQVPNYLLIGSQGRVGRHIRHYLSLLNMPAAVWCRAEPLSVLEQQLKAATHILVLISDADIESFIKQFLSSTEATVVHFSGSLVTDLAYGAHPLMTFHDSLYELEDYRSIPFVIDQDAPDFSELLPGLPNQSVRLSPSLKEKYHALCVLSGNFSCLLWQKFMRYLEKECEIPAHLSHPFFMRQMKNVMLHPETALTGPLVRGDTATIQRNIAALSGDAFQPIYKSFIESYQKIKEESK